MARFYNSKLELSVFILGFLTLNRFATSEAYPAMKSAENYTEKCIINQVNNKFVYSKEEDPNQIYYTVVREQLEAYALHSVLSSSERSSIDTTLQLLLDKLLFKYNFLRKYLTNDNEMSTSLLEDFFTDFSGIRHASNFLTYNKYGNRHFEFDDLCAVYNELFMYNLGFIEYLIEKHYLIKTLKCDQNMTKICKNFQEDFTLHLKRHQAFDKAYMSIDKLIMIYKGRPLCPFSANYLDIAAIMGFKLSILKFDLNEENLIENYNNLILGYIRDYFPKKNLDDLKQYTNFLITDNNIIRVIDKICVYGCDSEKLVHLALFIDKFPLVNSTVKAYIHYLNLFNKETFKEHSYDLLVLERAIEIKMEEPVFSLIDVNLREQFMKAYESLRSETKIIKHSIVKNSISKSRDVDVGLHTVLNKHSNYFPYEWIMLGAENIVQSFYDINPNEVSTILSLIQYFKLPEKRYAGYKQLLDIFIPGNNDMEMLRTAYYIKREKNEEYFASLKNFLPALIRRLIWNNGVNFCFLENNAYHQYLFTESTYTANGKDWTEFAYGKVEEYPRLAPLTLLDYQAYLFPWIFEYEKSSNSFLIKNFKGLYLSSREHDNGDGKFPLHFLLSEEEEGGNITATKWKFRLVNQSSNTESSSLFLLHDSNYPPRYLYAQNDTKNKFPNTREVFLSQLMTETDDFFWTLTCKDDTSEEDLPGKAEEEKSYEYITPSGTTDRCNDSKKVLPDLMNFRDETNIFISFLERLDMKRFSPFVKHSSTEDTPHFMELSKELDNFMKKTSVYLQVQFTELIGFSRYNLLLQRISYLHLSDIDIDDDDDNGEVDDEVQNNEAEEKETEDEKGDEMPTEQWKRTRRQYEQLEKTQNYRKINRYNNLLIREIERIMMVTLMHTDLFQNNSKLQKNNPPCARETFDICSKLSGYISKYVDYTLILNKIAEKTIEIHSKSQISKFLQALVYAKKSWVTLSANNVKKCLIKNGINTIQKFIEWKGQSTSGIDYYLNSNVIEIQRFKLLAKLIAETLAAMKFHLSEIYFMILKDSYKDYYVSQNPILKNTYSLYNISDYLIDGSCTACDENIHHYFAFFVSHLYKKNRLDADTASEVLNYTYRKLENSSQLTEPLRDTYSHKARQILQTLNDTEGHSLPIKSVNTSTDKTDTVKFKLNKLIIDENTRVMDFAKIITGKKLNEAKLARIRHRFYYFYRFSNVVKLTSFMYQLGGEESKCFKRIYEFIEYMKFYYQGSLQTDPLCWRCPPRNRPKDRVLLDTYDAIVSNLLLNNSQNDNRYAIELADYTYNKFGYIPCFHSGCVNDVETILPGYTRLYFEDKVCSLRSVPSGKYLSVSLNNHAVIYETHNFKPLTSIKVKTKGGTVKSQNKEVSPIIDSYYNWAFEYVENNGRFLIKSQNKQLYLSLENQKANSSDYYNLVLGNKYEKHPIEWTIDLQKNEVFSNQLFYIRPSGDLNNTSLYLSYNKTQQANLVLKLKSNNFKEDIDGLAFVWFIDCH